VHAWESQCNNTRVSYSERFAAAIRGVFDVSKPQPPPPPSSRHPRPRATSSAPPPPPSRGPRASVPPIAPTTEELLVDDSPRPPDSLIPVRFTDVLEELPADPEPPRPGPPRVSIRVLGAFLAGAVVMLAGETVLTRTNRTPSTRPAQLAPPPAPVQRQLESPKVLPAPAAPIASATATAEPSSPSAASVPPQLAAQTAASSAPSSPADGPQRTPPAPRRKRTRSAIDEPATAAFPD
jgi:hypothetical protein